MPVEVTRFVGREREVAELGTVLGEVRLLTVIGPGGVGKSRTALRVAAAARERYPDGVWLAELSALRDPELLPATLAAVLGLPESSAQEGPASAPYGPSGRPALDAVVAHLRERQALVVLDTCEHLLDACAAFADLVLREAPGVSVLATSRQPLDVPGEHCRALAPLDEDDAVALFAQRAADAAPGFAARGADAARVRALVRRLDGIPLALELAAVRLRAAPLDQLLDRVDDRFHVLTGGRRTALTRHQTLRTAVDWSYELCTPAERLLWARLSVFDGPFTPEAAEAVCADPGERGDAGEGGELPARDVFRHLIGLVDKSVVQRPGAGGGRYRMLDTLREYGAGRLAETGGAEAVRDRFLTYYAALAARLHTRLLSSEQPALHRTVHEEIPHLRAALGLSLASDSPGRASAGLLLAAHLWPYWRARAAISEGHYWLDKGLSLVPEDPPGRVGRQARAWALLSSGSFGLWTGDLALAARRLTRCLAEARRYGYEDVARYAEGHLAGTRLLSGDAEGTLETMARLRAEFDARGDGLGIAMIYHEEAIVWAVLGETDRARAMCDHILGHLASHAPGECQLRAAALVVRGAAHWLAEQGADGVGVPPGAGTGAAEADWLAALERCAEIGEAQLSGIAGMGLTWVAVRRGRWVRAAWLLGWSEGARKVGGDPVSVLPPLQAWHEASRAALRAELDGEAYRSGYEAGGRLTAAEVLDALRADADLPGGKRRRPARGADALTRREREVAGLVAEGLSNREIAERLVISKRTADAHVEHILAKLGVGARGEVGAALAGA
ncbi:LuxR C-terminal-related transcriptional regulator [Streptomyces sp. NPDC047046]|uniref:ATP-binding protein n=1 Tax=Streptomyces sp. NPDC047046 TaxID=3155378 RepID=UPI00340F2FDC